MVETITPLEIWTPETSGCSFSSIYDFYPSREGHIWIADYRNNRICELGEDGKLLRSYDQIQSPHGLYIDAKDLMYITNYRGNTLLKMTAQGQKVFTLGHEGVGAGEFVGTVSSVVNERGEIYVADYHNQRIQKFDSKGVFLTSWGGLGDGPGKFNLPHALALDKNGQIYVADRKNSRIQVFDASGSFLRLMVDEGSELLGVAVDDNLNVYAADMARHEVLVFSSEGKLRVRLGGYGSQPGQFNIPTNVRIDEEDRFLVSEQGHFRIQIFSLKQIQALSSP